MPQATNQPPTYAWPRFWIPLGGALDLSDAGFLSDPSNSHGPDRPVTLAALEGRRSLALLGEPGIGKSTTLKEEADRIEALSKDGVLQSSYVDLRSFSSEAFLFQRVFENEKMTRWKSDALTSFSISTAWTRRSCASTSSPTSSPRNCRTFRRTVSRSASPAAPPSGRPKLSGARSRTSSVSRREPSSSRPCDVPTSSRHWMPTAFHPRTS